MSESTVPQTASIESRVTPSLHAAEAAASAATFDGWAPKYEEHVLEWGYTVHRQVSQQGIKELARFVRSAPRETVAEGRSQVDLTVLDAGCGTGLCAVALWEELQSANSAGGTAVDAARIRLHGTDHSGEMLRIAAGRTRSTGEQSSADASEPLYHSLHCASLGTGPLRTEGSDSELGLTPDDSVALILCAGVFQPGGAATDTVVEFARALAVGGAAVFSVQLGWFQAAEYAATARRMKGCAVEVSETRQYHPDMEPEAEFQLVIMRKEAKKAGSASEDGDGDAADSKGISSWSAKSVSEIRTCQEALGRRLQLHVTGSTANEETTEELLGQLARCRYPDTVVLVPKISAAADELTERLSRFVHGESSLSLRHAKLETDGPAVSDELRAALSHSSASEK